MKYRILLTGAGGLLGGVLVKALSTYGHTVFGTRRNHGAGASGAEYLRCDLADAAAVDALVSQTRPDCVVHAAARIRPDAIGIAPFVRDNILATAHLLDAAQAMRVRRFVYISTISVYSGDGPFTEESATSVVDSYGWSKRKAEELCLRATTADFVPVILRLGGLHGHPRRDGVVFEFFRRAAAGEAVALDQPETETTLTFFDDVIAAVIRALEEPTFSAPAIFNVATAEAIKLGALAESIIDLLGGKSAIVSADGAPKRNRVLDTRRIRRELGMRSLSLNEHLKQYAGKA